MNLVGMCNSYKAKLQLPHYKKVDENARERKTLNEKDNKSNVGAPKDTKIV